VQLSTLIYEKNLSAKTELHMEEASSRRLAMLIIIFSLLWNAIIVVLLLCLQDDIHLQPPFIVTIEEPDHETTKEKDQELVYTANKLISYGSSPVGTTILPQLPSIQTTQPTMPTEVPSSQDETIEPSTIKPKTEEEILGQEETTQEDQEHQEQEEQKESPTTPDDVKQKQEEPSFYKEQEKITVVQEEQKLSESEYHEEIAEGIEKTARVPTHKQIQKTEAPKKKKITLADIAKGYMHRVAQEQEHTMETQIRSLPSSKQMALQVYSTKIFALLEQAAKVNKKMLYAPEDRTTNVILILTIGRDGRLLEASLTPPLHEKEVRDWLFSFINQVGLFPPIPSHLKQEKITLQYPLKIDMQQGFGTYSLYYGMYNRY